ncbi:MAG TPA: hypothetical protein VFC54_10870 [Pseudolabrys sp.]|nr:hypothetical protein [Pseudolabrys sp.]
MNKIIPIAVAALLIAVGAVSTPAQARDGAIAAGVVGGLAVGAIIGSQAGRDNGYRNSYYRRECRIERRDFEDRYGRLHVRRVRVCD